MVIKAALLQLNSGDDPAVNLRETKALIAEAVSRNSTFVLTPEVTNCVSTSRERQASVLRHEQDDQTLHALRKTAYDHGIWLLIGSLALLTDDHDGRFANRSFLIAPDGGIRARYDKIHMFDVAVSQTETYRESANYRPGTLAVIGETDFATIGMTICYDLRFPGLYRVLAQAGARILAVPSAFSPVTGAAHWESLLRARAIETGCFVLAPAQTGTHAASHGRQRQTHGHSLAVGPWGDILADGGADAGVVEVDLDMAATENARERIPSFGITSDFAGP